MLQKIKMKKNIFAEIKTEQVDKLEARLLKEQKELSNLRLEISVKKLKDTRKIFHKRKDISKILTVLNEKRRQK